jgi:hypothetical protein
MPTRQHVASLVIFLAGSLCMYHLPNFLLPTPESVVDPGSFDSDDQQLSRMIRTRRDLVSVGCRWQFVSYTPSAYETYWTKNIATLQLDVCGESNKQISRIVPWMTHVFDKKGLPESIFSKFLFQNNCTGETVTDYIEPLAGLMRNPYFCLKGEKFVVNKDYMVISWNVSRKVEVIFPTYVPKSYFFDLGASTYTTGSGGSSQNWFVQGYEAKGINWDGVYAWEVSQHLPVHVWSIIPPHLKPIYHWYNIPANPTPNHSDNPLEYIKRIARPEDFVLLKIDIDNTAVEEALVAQILASEELLGLIDDFYFEHHVNTASMNPYWGTQSSPSTLQDSYRIFSTLRSKGVAAHAWV